jgi:uncharacterized protein with HEPN domain
MSRSPLILLQEILDAIELIKGYVRTLDYNDFAKNVEKQDAVFRRLEIIGEAVKGLPHEVRNRYPEIPWSDIAGARDVLVHEYFRVDLELAWVMVTVDLHDLEQDILRVKSSEQAQTE